MKILQPGSVPGEKVYKTQCHNCQTVFQFQRAEALRIPDKRDGDYLSVVCPLPGCKQQITVAP